MSRGLLFLDRDGVLNEMVLDAEHGTVNSPLHPDQVVLRPGAAQAVRALTEALGLVPVIVSNQPAAAKGTTTLENIQAVHQRVLDLLAEGGVHVAGSYLCLHRSQDDCQCRKPRTGLLEQAWAEHPGFDRSVCWMVGDGITDIQAGQAFGVRTAYLGARKSDALNMMSSRGVRPNVWVENLNELIICLSTKGNEMQTEFCDSFLAESIEALQKMNRADIEAVVQGLARVRADGGRLFILGVGGSAGHASHAVNDFRKICGFEAYCPTDNVSELTARINDEGWDSCLAGWLEGSRLGPKDALLVFSVGGGNQALNVSTSLVRALELAKARNAKTFGIVGKDGGFTKQVANACVVVPVVSQKRVTPHTEGLCAVIWHLLVSHPALQLNPTKWESVTEPVAPAPQPML